MLCKCRLLLWIATTFINVCLYAVAVAQGQKICTVTAREYPGTDPAMWDGLYAAKDGKVYSGLISEGISAHFYVYDPQTDRNVLLLDLAKYFNERGRAIRTTGKIHNKAVEDREGNIYFCTMSNGSGPNTFDYTSWQGGRWMKYVPRSGEFHDLGIIEEGCYPLTIDPKRNYLYGIGFTGYFYRFDIGKRITKNLGRVSNWDICRDIFCDDKGNVYMSFPPGRIAKYDVAKEQVYETLLQTPLDQTLFPSELVNPMIDRTYIWRAVEWDSVGKVAYGVTGGGSELFKFDPYQGDEGKITTLGRMADPRFMDSTKKDIPYSTLAFALDSKNRKIYFAPSSREYALQRSVETFGTASDHHLIMYDIVTAQTFDLGVMKTADGRRVFGCEGASVDQDGRLYLCGQVEQKDKSKATAMAGSIPVALELIIYDPK